MGKEREMHIGWKEIAKALGVSEKRARRLFQRAGLQPRKMGTGKTSRVFLKNDVLFMDTLRKLLLPPREAFKALPH